ncbi:MAG: DinB family protein [Acidobacteria bacterium]|nr:DinB family protein [Acidobacteriota bacterium]
MRGSKTAPFLAMSCIALAASLLPPAPAEAKKKAAARSDFTSDAIANLARVGKQLISLAEAMPADRFSWRPNDAVRKVSEVYMHVVGPNILIPSLLGAAPPKGVTIPEKPFELAAKWESEITSKDEVIARLRESFDYAAEAIKTIPAKELGTEVDIFGFPASKRAYILILLSHAHEHLGQSIAYARSVGVVPPWSAPQQASGR